MFKSAAMRLRFRPENGMRVVVTGRVSVFPRDGAYQLYCNTLTPEGVGDLAVAFEQLKAKLYSEGLFDPAHKNRCPSFLSELPLSPQRREPPFTICSGFCGGAIRWLK